MRGGSVQVGRVLAGIAIALLCLVAGSWALSRALSPTTEQRDAVNALNTPLPVGGRDAFPALWTLRYPIPEDALIGVYQDDARKIAAIPEPQNAGDEQVGIGAAAYRSVAAARYPGQVSSDADAQRFCRSDEDCLKKVAADLVGYTALLERHAPLLDRIERLSQYGHVTSGFGYRVDAPMPEFRLLAWPRTRYALQFVRGERAQAFDGVCRAVTTWRRLGSTGDSLILRLIGASHSANVYGRLFADMLAETPNDFALPSSCATAFAAPSADEHSLCRAMRGEFAFMSAAVRESDLIDGAKRAWWKRIAERVVYDREATIAEGAEHYAQFCTGVFDAAIADDRHDLVFAPPPNPRRFACIGNAAGCILSGIAYSDYAMYVQRVQDANAQLAVMAALARIRTESGAPLLATRAGAAADDLASPQRSVTMSKDGRSLRLFLFAPTQADQRYWDAPLPGSRSGLVSDRTR
jgi:hypothetical protein